MKKNISIAILLMAMMMSFVSCNIEANRSYAGDLTITVQGLPAEVKAVALFCNLNEWEFDKINDTPFIQEVVAGKVSFTPALVTELKGYTYSEELQCQFVPLTSTATKLDGSWWNKAISGKDYDTVKDNLVYNFAAKGASEAMELTLDVTDNASKILVERVRYTNHNSVFTAIFK